MSNRLFLVMMVLCSDDAEKRSTIISTFHRIEEEYQAIIAAQKKSGDKLMIDYRLHCDPGNLEVLDRVRKGDFGDQRGNH